MKKGDSILVTSYAWTEGHPPTTAPHASPMIIHRRITRLSAPYLWCSVGRRMRLDERGLTWVPAWREVEVAAFRTACALGGVT